MPLRTYDSLETVLDQARIFNYKLYHVIMLVAMLRRCGGMVDTRDSKSRGRKLMSVRVRPAVPVKFELRIRITIALFFNFDDLWGHLHLRFDSSGRL